MKGKVLRETELSGTTAEINMSGLAQGMYLIRYRDNESAGTLKVNKL
jgi:hypothetical protein